MTEHRAWDDGAVNAAFDEVFGFHLPSKTVKTGCGKRVVSRKAGSGRVDCQDCDHESAAITNAARDTVIQCPELAGYFKATPQGLEPVTELRRIGG